MSAENGDSERTAFKDEGGIGRRSAWITKMNKRNDNPKQGEKEERDVGQRAVISQYS